MGNKKHGEEYEETRNGAITYLEKDMNDDVIMSYQNSPNPFTKQGITVLINQRNTQRKVLLKSIQEFEELKASIENDKKEENKESNVQIKTEENIDMNENGEAVINVENDEEFAGKNLNGDGSTNESDAKDDEKDIDAKIEELNEKADEMEALKDDFIGSEESVKNMRSSLLKDNVSSGIMLDARMKYEQAQDNLNYETAKHMIEKNILVAKREAVILEINRAIGKGENLEDLQNNLIDLNNQIDDLDQTFNNQFSIIQAEVTEAHNGLVSASKEVINTVRADFRNSYKQIQNYSEDGILKSEKIDMNKNMNRFISLTTYDDNILYSGKNGAIDQQTININGKVVRVVSMETSMGADTSFMNGNVMQMETGVGKGNTYVTRDSNGSLVADDPEVEDALKRIGINNIDDIGAACEEMDKKAEKREKEEVDEEQEYPIQSLNVSDED